MQIVAGPAPTPPTDPVTVSIDDLALGVAELWAAEPCVGPSERSSLLTDLIRLDAELDRLLLLRSAALDVPPADLRRCGQRYRALRSRWNGLGTAA